jgi:hypothetical protein
VRLRLARPRDRRLDLNDGGAQLIMHRLRGHDIATNKIRLAPSESVNP